jgi:hypothetical protein
MLAQVQAVDERVTTYATAPDYSRMFAEEMHSLHLLAFLLTADQDKAEKCFVSGLGECVERIGVFAERARSGARRVIVQHAIRIMRPVAGQGVHGYFVGARRAATSDASNPFAAIVSLGDFERFVFIMSVLEGQPDEDCESLLGCSRKELVIARELSLRLFAAANPDCEHPQSMMYPVTGLVN